MVPDTLKDCYCDLDEVSWYDFNLALVPYVKTRIEHLEVIDYETSINLLIGLFNVIVKSLRIMRWGPTEVGKSTGHAAKEPISSPSTSQPFSAS